MNFCKSNGEKVLYIIAIIIAIVLVAFIVSGNIKIIVVVGEKIDTIIKTADWKTANNIIKYFAH